MLYLVISTTYVFTQNTNRYELHSSNKEKKNDEHGKNGDTGNCEKSVKVYKYEEKAHARNNETQGGSKLKRCGGKRKESICG